MRRLLTGRAQRNFGFDKPFDVSVCQGIVFVSDTIKRQVHSFDFPAGQYRRIGVEGSGKLVKPMGLATDAQCRVYVADRQLRQAVIFEKDGTFVNGLGGTEWFNQLSHLAVEPDGSRLYLVDTGGVESDDHHRVRVFDPASGQHLYDFGQRGTAEGELNLPKDIEMGPGGLLHIVDSGNFRVQTFTTDGKFVRSFGSVGRQFGQFARPKGLAVDPAGNIYIVDAAFGNFQIFDSQGQLLLSIGGREGVAGPGVANLPSGIDVDEDGRIYFLDQFYRKVDIFRPIAMQADQGYLGQRLAPASE